MSPVYGYDLVQELAAVAREDPFFQRPVPISAAQNTEHFHKEFAAEITDLLRRIRVDSLWLRRVESFRSAYSKGWPSRFANLVSAGDLSLTSRVRLQPGVRISDVEGSRDIELCWMDQSMSIPAFLKQTIVGLNSEPGIPIAEMQGLMSGQEKVALIQSLLRSGMVEIVAL